MGWTQEEFERYRRRKSGKIAEEQANQDYEKESELQAECEAFLREKNIPFIHKKNAKGDENIALDLTFPVRGKFVAVELKIGKNKMSNEQHMVAARIAYNGGKVKVCRSLRGFKKFISEVALGVENLEEPEKMKG